MGQWKSQNAQHVHDMPGPRALARDGARPGWVWTCVDGLDFELIEFRRGDAPYSKWKDLTNGQIIELRRDN